MFAKIAARKLFFRQIGKFQKRMYQVKQTGPIGDRPILDRIFGSSWPSIVTGLMSLVVVGSNLDVIGKKIPGII